MNIASIIDQYSDADEAHYTHDGTFAPPGSPVRLNTPVSSDSLSSISGIGPHWTVVRGAMRILSNRYLQSGDDFSALQYTLSQIHRASPTTLSMMSFQQDDTTPVDFQERACAGLAVGLVPFPALRAMELCPQLMTTVAEKACDNALNHQHEVLFNAINSRFFEDDARQSTEIQDAKTAAHNSKENQMREQASLAIPEKDQKYQRMLMGIALDMMFWEDLEHIAASMNALCVHALQNTSQAACYESGN